MKPLKIDDIIDQEVQNLSGGELQRVALTLCLGKPADVYLIDEPSAYLDSEQRLVAAKVIKRCVRMRITANCQLNFSFQVYFTRKENRIRSGARFHNGHVSGRSCDRVRRAALREHDRAHAANAAGGNEPLFGASGNHVQKRPE